MRPVRIRPWPLLAALLAALVACEIVLWAIGYNWLQWYRPDPVLGWTLRPGLSGWFVGEGRGFVQVNSAGQRDREHAVEKPADVYRIAVIGDAYSEAMQVSLEDSFWARLPRRLEGCGFEAGKRIEVLNFGVRDYGTAQQYLVLEKAALRYQPDLVLLQFSHGNDLRDNYRPLDPVTTPRPYFTLQPDGSLRLDDSFARSQRYARRTSEHRELLTSLVNHSRVLQLARHAGLNVRDAVRARNAVGDGVRHNHALTPPRDARWEQAWRVTEAMVAKIGELASRNGASVTVVAVPFPFAVQPDAAERAKLLARHGVAHLDYPGERLAAFARQNGMRGIVLEPDMAALAASSRSQLYAEAGHWNELGHRVAAELIGRELCATNAKPTQRARDAG